MPANLTPQYKEAEERFRRASSHDEKLAALREMIALLPKHKGTEKLHADLKRRLSKLLHESNQRTRSGSRVDVYHVDKEGNPQVVVTGAPNAGKSLLVSRLSGVDLEVAPYPYSTALPVPAMMRVGGAQVQLVDTPPIAGDDLPHWFPNLLRTADAAVLVADLGDDGSIESVGAILEALAGKRVFLVRARPREEAAGEAHRPALLVGTRLEGEEQRAGLDLLRELYGGRLDVAGVSAGRGEGLDDLRERIFRLLGLVRVFTKQPGEPADRNRPYLLPAGSTVEDVARCIHKEIAGKLRFARIWGSGKFEGQQVSPHHAVEDGDVVEIHA